MTQSIVENPAIKIVNQAASVRRRLASMLYEVLLVAAIVTVSAFLFLGIASKMDHAMMRPLFQLYLLVVCGTYFVWFWTHGGQTVAMKAWRLRLTSDDGTATTIKQAVFRFIFAIVSLSLFGVGVAWAIFDRDKKFLHDRLAGTRLVCEFGATRT